MRATYTTAECEAVAREREAQRRTQAVDEDLYLLFGIATGALEQHVGMRVGQLFIGVGCATKSDTAVKGRIAIRGEAGRECAAFPSKFFLLYMFRLAHCVSSKVPVVSPAEVKYFFATRFKSAAVHFFTATSSL